MPMQIYNLGKQVSFHANDRILLGEGLFETIRVDESQPCYSKMHWHRMQKSAKALGIPFELTQEKWYEQLVHCIERSKTTMNSANGIKVVLMSGAAPRGLAAQSDEQILTFEAFTYTVFQKRFSLVSSSWLRDAKNPIYQHKSVNYLESILARRQALAMGADDVLFFNLEHYATETTVANLFMIKGETLMTPMLTNGVLAGVTRGRLLALCQRCGIACKEISIDKDALKEADVLFVTNALQGIMLIHSLDGQAIPTHHSFVSLLKNMLKMDEERYFA